MRKLLILTDESILAGCPKSGVAEVADSLANAMTEDYAVSVVAPDGNGMFVRLSGDGVSVRDGVRRVRMFGVDYYLVLRSRWAELAPLVASDLAPDVFHNFSAPELLEAMPIRPARCVYTIDQADFVRGEPDTLRAYDAVTTVSRAYAAELLAAGDALAATLAELDFRGITNGILSPVFAPEKGLLIPAAYSADDLAGKDVCKRRLCRTYGIDPARAVYLMACRLVRDKGLDEVIAHVHDLRDSGGTLLMVGSGDMEYERKLRRLMPPDGVIYLNKWPSAIQVIPLLAGADFYLSPSITEPCGLMPMTACRFGCIPLTTLSGGLADNMDESVALLVGDGGMPDALTRASALYADKTALAEKRRACMTRDYSWATRKQGYLEVYKA